MHLGRWLQPQVCLLPCGALDGHQSVPVLHPLGALPVQVERVLALRVQYLEDLASLRAKRKDCLRQMEVSVPSLLQVLPRVTMAHLTWPQSNVVGNVDVDSHLLLASASEHFAWVGGHIPAASSQTRSTTNVTSRLVFRRAGACGSEGRPQF
jgi:hypothetical protein